MSICVAFLAVALPVFDFATNSVTHRIAGYDPAVCLSRFVDSPMSRGCLELNDKFWLKDVDFSCVSPWNDKEGVRRAGTLISKRHIIFAKHYPLWKGVGILLVDSKGEVCRRSIVATKPLSRCDIMIGLLDHEVTPNIRPAKILPADYANYIGDGKGLPIVTFTQGEKVLLSQVNGITTNVVLNISMSKALSLGFGGKIVGGDSGKPAFLLIDKNPILLYCLLIGGSGYGPSVFHNRKEIQKAMDDLCPGYKLEAFDFSSLCTAGQTAAEKGK